MDDLGGLDSIHKQLDLGVPLTFFGGIECFFLVFIDAKINIQGICNRVGTGFLSRPSAIGIFKHR